MKLIFDGDFNGNPESLPTRVHEPNAVKFKEVEDSKQLAKIANIVAIFLLLIFGTIFCLRTSLSELSLWGVVLSLIVAFPHEILHAICFKGEVHLYTIWKQGMLFVSGTEDMSKSRFIFMSLLPNIVFGFIPFIIYLIYPPMNILGSLGLLAICMGTGDYYNVYNAVTQMPSGSRTYLYQFNSYWYMPK